MEQSTTQDSFGTSPTIHQRSRRLLSERLFGFDVFISFALGEPPRGTFTYASDLARRLQAADHTVFLCEDRLECGESLNPSIESAIKNSRSIVFIVNKDTLENPGWLKTELAYFRHHRKARPIIPICLDDSLNSIPTNIDPPIWHDFHLRKFITESPSTSETGDAIARNASDTTVNSITSAISRFRSNLRWRALVCAVMVILVSITGAALRESQRANRSRSDALHQRDSATMLAVAGDLRNGEYENAIDRIHKNSELPSTFVQNIAESSYKTSDPVPDYDGVNELGISNAEKSRYYVLAGRYSGVRMIPAGGATQPEECPGDGKGNEIKISADDKLFAVLGYQSIAIGNDQGCSDDRSEIHNWNFKVNSYAQSSTITALLPLKNRRLMIGLSDGRVGIFEKGKDPQTLARLPAGIIEILTDKEESRVGLLDHKGLMHLVDINTRSLIATLPLISGIPKRITTPKWRDFLTNLSGGRPKSLAYASTYAKNTEGASSFVISIFPSDTNTTVLYRNFDSAHEVIFDAAAYTEKDTGCEYVSYLKENSITSELITGSCDTEDGLVTQNIAIPQIADSPTDFSAFSSGIFCGEPGEFVVGTWGGYMQWMRLVRFPFGWRTEVERVEHAETDAVSTLKCIDNGAIYGGFRSKGVKAYKSKWRVETKLVGKAIEHQSIAQPPDGDSDWAVSTFDGASNLHQWSESGYLELTRGGTRIWKRNISSTIAYQTGDQTDAIAGLAVDQKRSRIWVLTSLGVLSLLELNTGTVLSRFATDYFSALPASDLDASTPALRLLPNGALSIRYEVQGNAMEILVTNR